MLNMLSPMLLRESNKMVFMDFLDGKVYECKVKDENVILVEVESELKANCFNDVKEQQEAMRTEVPYEKIRQIFNVEKELEKKNSNFRNNL
jgi:hypothetical protein